MCDKLPQDKIEASHELVGRYYMMLDAQNDELSCVLEAMQKKHCDDFELVLALDVMICNLAMLRRVSTDIQEANLLQLSSFATDTLSDLITMCMEANDEMPPVRMCELDMIRHHINRDCTLVTTKK
jgi:hypothetical protein